MRQVNWLAVIPQALLMFAIMIGLEYGLKVQGGSLIGAMIYFGIFYLLQMLIPHHHRRGLLYIRRGDYTNALESFRQSFVFFTEKAWLDKYRAILMLSNSKMSYREMALLNIAYCYVQLEQYDKAKEAYHQVLAAYPNSEMAKNALSYFDKEQEVEQE